MTVLNLRRWFRDPLFLLALAAGLIAFVVQSGELGSADTTHRLQTAHAWWTGEPEVFPNEFPEFGVHGRGGKLQSWYSMGQSLILLPPDMVGTYVARLPIFAEYDDTDPSVRDIIVSYTINILVTVLTALVCFRFLRQLNFGVTPVCRGSSGSAARHHASPLHPEHDGEQLHLPVDDDRLLLSVRVVAHRQPARTADWLGCVRPQSADPASDRLGSLVGSALPAAWSCGSKAIRGRDLWGRCKLTSRLLCRFTCFSDCSTASIRSTALGLDQSLLPTSPSSAAKPGCANPSLPPNYPFETPWHVGFFGALFTPEKSIFLFDPLIVLMILLVRRRLEAIQPGREGVRRHELPAAPGVHEFLRPLYRVEWRLRLGRPLRLDGCRVGVVARGPSAAASSRSNWESRSGSLGLALLAISTVIQLVSLAFWLPLEIYQMETLGHPTFVIALRMKNIVAFALGKMDAWGLNNHAMTEDPWDYVHITDLEFSAICSAASWRCAHVGGAHCVRSVGAWACCVGGHSMANPQECFSRALASGDFACILKQFPALQCDGHIAIVPDKVVELQHGKIFALHAPGIGEKLRDL